MNATIMLQHNVIRSTSNVRALMIEGACEDVGPIARIVLTCDATQVANRKCNERRGPGGCYNSDTTSLRGGALPNVHYYNASGYCLERMLECQHTHSALTESQHSIGAAASKGRSRPLNNVVSSCTAVFETLSNTAFCMSVRVCISVRQTSQLRSQFDSLL